MSPRTPKQFQDIREEKKTLIMDVALEHFANEGYFKTTINHIARHAGISKGLMYNYFVSKEELLSEIINRSIAEIYVYFDPDKDGYLTEDEFESFVRKCFMLLKKQRSFWRLFFQLLMQKDVREQFLSCHLGSIDSIHTSPSDKENTFLSGILKSITEYFTRKKERMLSNYDPVTELNLFIYAVKGFAITAIYMDENDDFIYEKTVNRIIEIYK
jgi:AcrR family transcriptional regulator